MEEAARLGRSVFVEDIWNEQDQVETDTSPTDGPVASRSAPVDGGSRPNLDTVLDPNLSPESFERAADELAGNGDLDETMEISNLEESATRPQSGRVLRDIDIHGKKKSPRGGTKVRKNLFQGNSRLNPPRV